MSNCKIYPADTVDIYGNVWPTVGENIRNNGVPYGKTLKTAKISIKNSIASSNDIEVNSHLDEGHFDIKNIYPVSINIIKSTGVNLRLLNYGCDNFYTFIYVSGNFKNVECVIEVMYFDR